MKTSTIAALIVTVLGALISAQATYVVGPPDVLTITVFGEPDLSGKFTVEQDGTFAYPQLGRVKAAGRALRDIEQDLKTKLADGYLKNPQVSVTIETYRSQRILIMGEVRSPGEYQLAGEMTLLAALIRAGGPTPAAGREIVIVRPPVKAAGTQKGQPEDPELIRVDVAALQAGNAASNIQLQDGDAINVLRSQAVFVTGQVKAPGAYPVDRGTTVLQVLSLAGGVSDRGSDRRIRILRIVNGRKTELRARLGDQVEPGDTVVVPERFF
jgi:polysaccharide export outer membrane protein